MVANAEDPKPKITLSRLTNDQNEMYYRKISRIQGTGTKKIKSKQVAKEEFKGWL